jgi:hypothetical protein
MRVYPQNQICIYLSYMFILKPIGKISSAIKYKTKYYCELILNLPTWYKEKIQELIKYLIETKYKVTHLKETNFKLGIDHLYRNNLNDAILRLNMVEKFFAPGDHQAHYWLGWVHFLKDNYTKSLSHLQKAFEADNTHLGDFLKNYSQLSEIPPKIDCQYRNLIAKYYGNRFLNNNKLHMPYSFVKGVMKEITDLPDHYSILELGSNIGLIGHEVKKRFPDQFTYTGVENSRIMNEIVISNYSNTTIYDQLLESSIPDFMQNNSNNYNIILSFCGLSFTKNLSSYFKSIYSITTKSGYFAFCLPVNQVSTLSLKRKEFIFTISDITNALAQTKFTLLSAEELELEKNSKYYMVVCKK